VCWLCGGSPLRLHRCTGLKGRFERKIERFLRPSVQTLWVLTCLQHRMITGCHHGVETWIVLLISSGTISDIWAQLLDVSDVRSTQPQNIAGQVLGVPIHCLIVHCPDTAPLCTCLIAILPHWLSPICSMVTLPYPTSVQLSSPFYHWRSPHRRLRWPICVAS
jgi:hypothetical protein